MTFYLGLKQVSRTTHLNAQNDQSQISQELVSVRDLAEDIKVGGNGEGGDNKTVKRSALSKKSSGPIGYFISLRSDAEAHLSQKDEFPLIVLAMVKALS